MKNILIYMLSFCAAFVFTVIGMAAFRSFMASNDHIHLFSNGAASYVADYSCTIDAPLGRSVESMQASFDECVRLHKEYQEHDRD